MARKARQIRNAAASREALMEAGARLFARKGFAATSLDAIAEDTGLNKAMVAYYFGSKTGLYQAILDQGVSRVLERVDVEALEARPPDLRLPAFARALARGFEAAPYLPGMLVQDYLSGEQQMRPEAAASLARNFEVTRAIIERGTMAGVFRAVDPHQVHLVLIGALVFFRITKPFRDKMQSAGRLPYSNPDPEDFAEFIGEMIARGLKSDSTPEPH
ncbi:TetR/AcrR family transcriptional regulator [Hyphobacterium sp. HN65]|uniref:TetR/AcrR family transcriptional regulator n=1 Tax=Hyphobacterium lacteum TaxID=3116575 RepID=A0ABU7LQR3_9PROT|nr:TetR/AcrR family transcriptional regulator [Hyphobacterium sp. HN65]MEE2525976.1 TetR/AcrR family transcriptional regulator [Hyphobacterium sp. HN65]